MQLDILDRSKLDISPGGPIVFPAGRGAESHVQRLRVFWVN